MAKSSDFKTEDFEVILRMAWEKFWELKSKKLRVQN